ncbi:MFS general substrate transporter [Patellaria atrata CBS 101060]|uniref:MFS general substrate transporter n=1 Tax=Patellaria atrata CBS 101060 TaxID=1346257 RepID=A0A9P4SDE3_9PEZI|nr:MFS general substrate transporter [Patellaria atrata CBS 101060]
MATIKSVLSVVSNTLGISAASNASRDVWIIIISRSLRGFAFGLVGLILALYLASLGFSDTRIGLFMTLTLLGDAILSLALTQVADKVGRRIMLLFGACGMMLAGTVFVIFSNYWIMLLVAIVGVISVGGNEIGPFRAIEESIIAQLTDDEIQRSYLYQWYNVFMNLAAAAGLAVSGWLTSFLREKPAWKESDAYRVIFYVYSAIGLAKALFAISLSRKCELELERNETSVHTHLPLDLEHEPLLPHNHTPVPPNIPPEQTNSVSPKTASLFTISPTSRLTLLKLALLFALDSFASGMAPWPLLNYWLVTKFPLRESALGTLMSCTTLLSTLFALFSGALTHHLGPIPAMVLPHAPAALFLVLLPFPQTIGWTVVLLVLRAALNAMDQSPRSAFVASLLGRQERTAGGGVLMVAKTLAQAAGPVITGGLAQGKMWWIAFVVAGALKGLYDLGLLVLFGGFKWGKSTGKGDDGEDVDGSEAGEEPSPESGR